MTVTFILIWIFAFVLGGTAVGALIWAARSGQFHNVEAGARVIFDEDEPEGMLTDNFPGAKADQP